MFKTLFSREELVFSDYCETKTVTTALYLDFGDGIPHFVGRAGSFVPVREGTGGAILLRGKEDKFHAVTGTKGFFWKEAAVVKELGLEDDIDLSYYKKLADAAIDNLSKHGDIDWLRE